MPSVARPLVLSLACVGVVLPAPLIGPRDLQAKTFLVDFDGDSPDVAPGDGTCATQGGNCSVRAAFQEAAALPGEAHEIVLSRGTAYLLDLESPIVASGDVVLTRSCGETDEGEIVTCALDEDVDLDRTISVEGGDKTRLLEVIDGASLRVRGIALRGGFARSTDACPSGLGGGGAICSHPAASLALESTLVEGSEATVGGAVAGPVTVYRSTVQGNAAREVGGGLYAKGVKVTVEQSTVDDNTVRLTEGAAPSGPGGGIAIVDGGGLSVVRSTISRNVAFEGGGIYLDTPVGADLRNSTVSSNEASGAGGGLRIACADCAGSPPVELTHVTIAANSAGASGTAIATTGTVALARMTNTLVATNPQAVPVAGRAPVECSGPMESGGGNLLVSGKEDPSVTDHGCPTVEGDVIVDTEEHVELGGLGAEAVYDDASHRVALAPTETHGLLADSPALGAGTATACASTDQLGRPRLCSPAAPDPADMGCDIGASERLPDGDGDVVPDCVDLCPTVVDPTNARDMGDPNLGDACEDTDGDGVFDPEDACTRCFDRNGDGVIDEHLDGCDGRAVEGMLRWDEGCTALDRCPCEGKIQPPPPDDEGARLLRWKSRSDWRRCIKKAVRRHATSDAERGARAAKRTVLRSLLLDPGLSADPPCGTRRRIPGVDSDGDGFADAEGIDVDGDGRLDPVDNCPKHFNRRQLDLDDDAKGSICDRDLDGDGVPNGRDNCPRDRNRRQRDMDDDGEGDACDLDIDGDHVGNGQDNCPRDANADQLDEDQDGTGDACDRCVDPDGDGFGSPGFPRTSCPHRGADNCPNVANADQLDTDKDGVGDACQSGATTTTTSTTTTTL